MQVHRIPKERSQHRILEVHDGRVVCPRQGSVDLGRCWVCPAYDGLSGGRLEGVVCRADPADLIPDARPGVR